MPDKVVTAAVLVIGNEILSGRTRDTNLAWLAGELTKLGIRLTEARVVADTQGAIVAAVRDLKEKYNYVFTTGGIGPTHDDITAEAVAMAFGVPLVRHLPVGHGRPNLALPIGRLAELDGRSGQLRLLSA